MQHHLFCCLFYFTYQKFKFNHNMKERKKESGHSNLIRRKRNHRTPYGKKYFQAYIMRDLKISSSLNSNYFPMVLTGFLEKESPLKHPL